MASMVVTSWIVTVALLRSEGHFTFLIKAMMMLLQLHGASKRHNEIEKNNSTSAKQVKQLFVCHLNMQWSKIDAHVGAV